MPLVHAMLLALETATEAYLDRPLNTTDIALPASFFQSRSDLLDLEVSRMGLRRTLGGYPSALRAAMYPRSWPWTESELSGSDDPCLILAVDYSGSALTAGLFSVDNDVLDEHRFVQGLNLGADASPSHLPWSKELSLKRRKLLQEVTNLPVTDARYELPDGISDFVLIGDRAKDAELLELLKEVLGPVMVARVRSVQKYDNADPIFTAAKSMAAEAKIKIDEGEQLCLPRDCTGWWDEWMGS